MTMSLWIAAPSELSAVGVNARNGVEVNHLVSSH